MKEQDIPIKFLGRSNIRMEVPNSVISSRFYSRHVSASSSNIFSHRVGEGKIKELRDDIVRYKKFARNGDPDFWNKAIYNIQQQIHKIRR